ncbi:MAG: GNAT family N-acetyltransferase [Betaproteobacteria bacterium]
MGSSHLPAVNPADAYLETLTEADFEFVAGLADTIWRSHYASIVSRAQIDYMLAGRYTAENLRAYLGADDRWMELLKIAGTAIGYCSYARSATPGELKLEQLYLLPAFKGRGLGGFMLRHVESRARELGMQMLMLQVNKQNVDSIGVYRKTGYAVRAEVVFDIGNGFVMDDYVMEKAVSSVCKD